MNGPKLSRRDFTRGQVARWVEQDLHDYNLLRALRDTVKAWQAELPGVEVVPVGPDTYEVSVPPALDGGHETHFARVLDEFLRTVDDRRWPAALAERTLAKYTLLAEAAARTSAEDATLSARGKL